MELHPCARRTLAAGELVVVERCTCGAVHLTIGAVTLRVAARALPEIAGTLGDAARALATDRTARLREEVLS